ncbi:MAG: PilZ domain-containing protein [Rhizobiaceae bacterium]
MNAVLASNQDTDRRAYERLEVAIFGRALLENTLEIPCQATSISPGEVAVVAAHKPVIGEHVIMYLDHIGRLDGKVVNLFDSGFAMTISGTARKREKLSARIEWLKAHNEFGLEDHRRHERITPRNINSEIKLTDGRAYPIEIIDISLSGAAVKTEVKPAIGSQITLSGMQGQVVRHFAEGVAIEFSKPAPLELIEKI